MKTRILSIMLAGVVALLGLSSCGGKKSTEPSPLVSQSLRLNGVLKALAEKSPMFIENIDVEYADAVLGVAIEFSDPTIEVEKCSDELVQFVLAQYLKSHTGPNLDEIINTLAKEEGSLKITLSDADGNSREYAVTASRLKLLLRLKPMELNYNAARTNVVEILESRCDTYKDEYNAEEAELSIVGGFAQYTLTFERAQSYSNLKQSQLTGRYLKKLQERYNNFGACRPIIEDLLRSLSIDGYRYVYTEKKGNKTLTAAIPWRLIE